jgi:hypothetical protein
MITVLRKFTVRPLATVCSSSTNSTIRPSAALTSPSTALSRSSNSPRYFAPATSDPMSRAKIVLSCNPSGTSPRTIRCARPSTMTLRISASRPITGSSLPARASTTRSRP